MTRITLRDGRVIETNDAIMRLPYDDEIAEGRFPVEVKPLESRADFIARVKQLEKDCDKLLKNPLGAVCNDGNDGNDGVRASVTTVTTVTTDAGNDGARNDGNDGLKVRGTDGKFRKGARHPMSGRERIKAFRARKKGAGDGQ